MSEDIKLDIIEREDTPFHQDIRSESSKDIPRSDALWTSRSEETLNKWKDDCVKKSGLHDIQAKKCKRKNVILTIPSICLPLILSGIQDAVNGYSYVNSSVMAVTSILIGCNSFLGFEKKQMKNFEYSALYFKLATTIEKILTKKKCERAPVDVVLEQISQEYNQLNVSSPVL